MKELILIGLMGLMGLMMAEATPQTRDADLKAAQSPPAVIDGLFVMSDHVSSISGTPVHFTDLMFGAVGGGGAFGGPYFVADSPVAFYAGPYPEIGSGNVTASMAGEVSVLTMDDTFYTASGPCGFECDDGGGLQVDSWTVNLTFGSSTATLNASQSAPLAIGAVYLGTNGNTAILNAPAVTSLSCTGSINCSIGTLTMNGAFDQPSVDGILAAAIVGGSGGAGSLTIGGSSAAPSSTGSSNEATLVADGITVTTN